MGLRPEGCLGRSGNSCQWKGCPSRQRRGLLRSRPLLDWQACQRRHCAGAQSGTWTFFLRPRPSPWTVGGSCNPDGLTRKSEEKPSRKMTHCTQSWTMFSNNDMSLTLSVREGWLFAFRDALAKNKWRWNWSLLWCHKGHRRLTLGGLWRSVPCLGAPCLDSAGAA